MAKVEPEHPSNVVRCKNCGAVMTADETVGHHCPPLGTSECDSCGDPTCPEGECSKSPRPCGHHCNHSWDQDRCCWCRTEFGEANACPFCAIVAGDAPAKVVREWDDAIAIVPLNPVVPGHTLVIPKRHVQSFFSDPAVSAATMRRAAEMVHGVERHIDPNDYNVITSCGQAATQTVLHLHVHLVPRRQGDGLALPWTRQVPTTSAPPATPVTDSPQGQL